MGALWDVIFKGGRIVQRTAVIEADLAIKDGVIQAIAPVLAGHATQIVDATGLIILPGVIDVHVHLNEPSLGHWEGFSTGTAALAAGGCTTFIDMPLNGLPPTINKEALDLKLEAAKGHAHIDYALWGGLVPDSMHALQELADEGVAGFKAFMSDPGGNEEGAFREVRDPILFEGMRRIAKLGKVLALHAEDEVLVASLARECIELGRTSADDYTRSRPVEAELLAVSKAIEYANYTGCSLHIVHVSSARVVELIDQAKRLGVDITLETCPHYLTLTSEDLHRHGAVAKCAPPLRDEQEQEQLWLALLAGKIDMIASDHSPCPSELKKPQANFFQAWGGISGAQSTLELMLDEGWRKRGMALPMIADRLSTAPAARFGLSGKGEIAIGMDADLTLIDPEANYVLSEADLLYKHRHSPYIGKRFSCRVRSTWVRGEPVYDVNRGRVKQGHGRWIQPIHGQLRRRHDERAGNEAWS